MSATDDAQAARARRHMVDSQILPNRITDERLIAAMETLPREVFLPSARRPLAYVDESVPIEDGRYLMQPMVLGRLLQTTDAAASDVALAIGCATGYGVAVLASLVDTVVAIESDAGMRQKAEKNLQQLGIDNVAVVEGSLAAGHPEQAPFDVIYFDGAVPAVPDEIAQQLSEGGRLVAVEMGPGRPVGRGVLVTRFGDAIAKREVFDAVEPLLPGFDVTPEFAF